MTGEVILDSWWARCADQDSCGMPRPVGMATRDRGKFWNLSLLAERSFWAGLVLALPPAVSLQTCWTPARARGQDQPRESGHTQPTYTHAYRHPQSYYKPTQTNTHAFAASCQSLPEQQNATDLLKLPQACCYCLFYISNLAFLCGIWLFSFNLFPPNHLFSFLLLFQLRFILSLWRNQTYLFSVTYRCFFAF